MDEIQLVCIPVPSKKCLEEKRTFAIFHYIWDRTRDRNRGTRHGKTGYAGSILLPNSGLILLPDMHNLHNV